MAADCNGNYTVTMTSVSKSSRWLIPSLAAAFLVLSCATTPANDGETLFARNCANCHGPYGEGDGHGAVVMNISPQDLRQIAQRNGGIFPRDAVVSLVDGREQSKEHFLREMPVWGEQFAQHQGDVQATEADVQAKINTIVDYLESIQH